MDDPVVAALTALVPTGVHRGETDRGGRVLRWVEAGAGGPPIVLVAGRGDAVIGWATVFPALAAVSRVRAYDRAGLGASDPDPATSLRTQVDDLAAILADLPPTVLVGHSWGGLLAQLAAFANPGRVAGMVLIDPSHEDQVSAVPWPLRMIDDAIGVAAVAMQSLGASDRIARRMGQRQADRCTDDPGVRTLIMAAYVASYSSRRHARTMRAEARLVGQSAALVRDARIASDLPDLPLVVLSATSGLPPGARARFTALQIAIAVSTRRGRHLVVDGAGHYIHHDQPGLVVDAIRSVVAEAR